MRWLGRAALLLLAAGVLGSAAAQVRPTITLTELGTVPVAALGLPVIWGRACSAYDSAVCHDLSAFYQPRQRQVAQASVLMMATPAWGVHLTWRGGVDAPKLAIAPRIKLGMVHTWLLAGGGSLAVEAHTSLGGALSHRPCLDAYDRAYFCVNLTAWADYPAKTIAQRDQGVKLHWRF